LRDNELLDPGWRIKLDEALTDLIFISIIELTLIIPGCDWGHPGALADSYHREVTNVVQVNGANGSGLWL
jgi:hypothetical protein